jgi:hypothetical protein
MKLSPYAVRSSFLSPPSKTSLRYSSSRHNNSTQSKKRIMYKHSQLSAVISENLSTIKRVEINDPSSEQVSTSAHIRYCSQVQNQEDESPVARQMGFSNSLMNSTPVWYISCACIQSRYCDELTTMPMAATHAPARPDYWGGRVV